MSKKVMIAAACALLAVGAAYKLVLAKPDAADAKSKVEGNVYILGKEFLVNLEGGHFAKLTVALVLAHDDTSAEPAGGHGAAKPPEGFGAMPQEAVVRDVITDELTGRAERDLVERDRRAAVKKAVVKDLRKHTDVHVEDVLFTDVTVQ